jgi:hypothetical protein
MPDSPKLFSPGRTGFRFRLGSWILAASLAGSAMAMGSVHTTVLLVVTASLGAATWLIYGGAEPTRPRPSASLLFWTCALLTLWTLLQALPLPIAWIRALSPETADVWDRALLPLREAGPAWATLSLDPVATRVQVVRGAAYLLAFVAAVRVANRREGALFLEGSLLVAGVAIAIATWVHPALGANKVFGFYVPVSDVTARHVAPILNPNVLSGYLNIALCLAFGQAVAPRPRVPRPITLAVAAFLVATQFWVASRGGMVGMATGLALVFWMSRAPGPGERPWLWSFVPAVLLIAGIAFGVLSSSEDAWVELTDSDVSKLELGLRALHLVPLFPLFGVGRGAFESAFPFVRIDPGHWRYTHPENLIAQWPTEWGLPVALAASVALLVALRPRSALTRSPRAAGAWGALACVGVHNLVDFSSEFPGVVLTLAACAALVVGGTSGVNSGRAVDAWAKRPREFGFCAVAIASLAVALGLSSLGREVQADREALSRDALNQDVSRATFHSEVRAAMLRHPAEPFLPFTGAIRAVRAKDESVVGWIERTLERAPVYGPAHFLLARALSARSPAQARLEYRLAIEQAPNVFSVAQAEPLTLVHSYDDATEIVARGPRRASSLRDLSRALETRLPATSARFDVDLVRLEPNSLEVAARRATAALADLEEGQAAPWCVSDPKACLDDALLLSSRYEKLAPASCDGFYLHAEALLVTGNAEGAVRELSDATGKVNDRTYCLERLAEVARAARRDPPLSETLDQIARAGCAEVKECVGNLRWVAGFEAGRGNRRRALSLLQRAAERDPNDDELLAEVAKLASAVDLHAEALRAYEDLARRHPTNREWQAGIAAERTALFASSAKL